MSLSNITILITSLLRPGYLRECLNGIRTNLPECSIVVVDDSGNNNGKSVEQIVDPAIVQSEQFVYLPFDSGLTVKRNAGVQTIKTKYTLLGSDDFDFSTSACRAGIMKLLEVLETSPDIDIASGRHPKDHAYEGYLDYVPGSHIKETRLKENPAFMSARGYSQESYKVDLTVNYFLARTDVLVNFPWDETIVPIGGEHGDFFLTLKENDRHVVWVPGVWIDSLPVRLVQQNDPRYAKLRGRARETGHKIFLAKRGITNYYGFDDPVPQSEVVRIPISLPNKHADKVKPLIMVMSCCANRGRIAEIQNTWLRDASNIDVRFFVGKSDCLYDFCDPITMLDVPDDYKSLPLKVQAAFRWALDNGYTNAFKTDDDCYVVPQRLLANVPTDFDYVGRVNANPTGYWASGGSGYWLSRTAMQIVVDAEWNGDWAEDRWVGSLLGNRPHHDPNYTLYGFPGESLSNFHTACNIIPNQIAERKLPNQVVTMEQMHRSFKSSGRLPEFNGYKRGSVSGEVRLVRTGDGRITRVRQR